MPRGYAPSRRDSNHQEIVDHARDIGFSILETHSLAGGLDVVWGIFQVTGRAEIKDGGKSASRRKLTEAEQSVFDNWCGREPDLWMTVDDVKATRDKVLEEAKQVVPF